jgi:hypothetical protein
MSFKSQKIIITLQRYRMVLLIFVIVSTFIFLGGCFGQNGGIKAVELLVNLHVTKHHLIVDNGNAFVWRDVTIKVNNKYFYKTDFVPRGKSSFHLSEFVDKTGLKLNPEEEGLRKVYIHVPNMDDYLGKGEFTW